MYIQTQSEKQRYTHKMQQTLSSCAFLCVCQGSKICAYFDHTIRCCKIVILVKMQKVLMLMIWAMFNFWGSPCSKIATKCVEDWKYPFDQTNPTADKNSSTRSLLSHFDQTLKLCLNPSTDNMLKLVYEITYQTYVCTKMCKTICLPKNWKYLFVYCVNIWLYSLYSWRYVPNPWTK